MNYLRKFESVEEYKDEIEDIRSVLIDLKDEYPYIEGNIFAPEEMGDDFEIILNCKNVIKKEENDKEKFKLKSHNDKLKFINYLIKIIERLENVLHRESSIIGIWDWADGSSSEISIYLIEN